VRGRGLEPPLLSEPEPKSGASTSFAILAYVFSYLDWSKTRKYTVGTKRVQTRPRQIFSSRPRRRPLDRPLLDDTPPRVVLGRRRLALAPIAAASSTPPTSTSRATLASAPPSPCGVTTTETPGHRRRYESLDAVTVRAHAIWLEVRRPTNSGLNLPEHPERTGMFIASAWLVFLPGGWRRFRGSQAAR
jgi:hypothetical protein